MDNLKKISSSLIDVLETADLHDVSANIVDALADDSSIVAELGGIPIVGSLVGLVRAGASIRDQIFCRKLLAFLKCMADVSLHDRLNAIREIENDPKYRTKVGDRLLSLLDRCDSESKAEIIAWLFSAYLDEKGTYDDFLRSSAAINLLVVEDIDSFVKYQDVSGNLIDVGPVANTELVLMDQEAIQVEKAASEKEHRMYGDYIVRGGELKYSISDVGNFVIEALQDKRLCD